MTAEVAVLNKMAVALAADSAVTIGWGTEQKIYNSVNKLFALSKYRPVGVMVFGNAEFMGVPWEAIIKFYRAKFFRRSFNTLGEYAADFISFLENENSVLWSPQEQEDYFRDTVTFYLESFVSQINEQVKLALEGRGELADTEIVQIVSDIITREYNEWETAPSLSETFEVSAQATLEKYGEEIEKIKRDAFQQLPISDESSKQITRICTLLFYKKKFPDSVSGVVVAGFGEKEIFPSAVSYTFEGIILGKLKHTQQQFVRVDRKNEAIIVPFAQSEMVNTFIEGIDPSFFQTLQAYVKELVQGYPESLIAAILELTEERKEELGTKFKTVAESVLTEFSDKVRSYINETHVSPILQAVAALPKDELAAMAESLVNLTSFKRKVSLEAETVGGPIDVAVISKGDGFIWIKRKHYFKPELNQAFFSNYYREDE